MSAAAEDLYHCINGMESELNRLDGLTQLMFTAGTAPDPLDPLAVDALANALSDVLTQVQHRWERANALAWDLSGQPATP